MCMRAVTTVQELLEGSAVTDSALNPQATGPLPAAKPRPSSPLPVTFLGIARSSLAFLLIAGVSVTRPDAKASRHVLGVVENGTGAG